MAQSTEKDFASLAKWLDGSAAPAEDYVVGLFSKHDVVIVGEFHHIKEHKDFVIGLIPRLYHEAGVRCIGWEFSRHTDNARLDKLVSAADYDREAALNFARDQSAHEWNSKEHWDIIEAVWRLNKSLEAGRQRMRLIGLQPDLDFPQIFITMKTKAKGSAEYQQAVNAVACKYDPTMAAEVEKEIIQKGQKGLVFVGRCHDSTHYEFPPEINYGREIMGNLLYKKYGDRVFQVWEGGSDFLPAIEEVMKLRGYEQIGFDLYASPFANIRTSASWSDAPGVPLRKVARGYVYLGPRTKLHKNTPIEGFVTEEMFKRYRRYYEVDFGRSFKSAEEVDKYLQAHRFPDPQAR